MDLFQSIKINLAPILHYKVVVVWRCGVVCVYLDNMRENHEKLCVSASISQLIVISCDIRNLNEKSFVNWMNHKLYRFSILLWWTLSMLVMNSFIRDSVDFENARLLFGRVCFGDNFQRSFVSWTVEIYNGDAIFSDTLYSFHVFGIAHLLPTRRCGYMAFEIKTVYYSIIQNNFRAMFWCNGKYPNVRDGIKL